MRPSSPPISRAKQPAILVTLLALMLAAVAFLAVPLAGAIPSSPLTQTYSGTLLSKIGATNQVVTSPNVITVTSVAGLGSSGGYNGNITEVNIEPNGGPVNGDVMLDTTTSGWTRQVGSTSKFTLNTPSDEAAMVYINGAWRQLKKTTGKPTVSANFTQSGQLVNLLISGQATNGKTVVAVEIKSAGAGLDSAPFVVTFDPADESTDVPESVTPTILFNEPITADESAFALVCNDVPVAFTIGGSGTTLITVTPTAPLGATAICVLSVDLSLVSDTDGFAPASGFGIESITFAVGGSLDVAPEVVLANSTPSTQDAEIGNSDTIQIAFSEAVTSNSGISVVCDTNTISVTETPGLSDTIQVAPLSGSWPYGASCTLTVDKDLITDDDTDDGPDNMLADFVLTFTTEASPDTAPEVLLGSSVPSAQDAVVGYTAKLHIVFSEDVTATGAFSVVCDSSTVDITVVKDESDSYEITPNSSWGSEGSSCTLTVDKDLVADDDALDPPDNMVADFVLTFTITVEDPPMIISLERLRPGTCFGGGSGQSCGNIDENNLPAPWSSESNIQVNFTEEVNLDAGAFTLVCGSTAVAFTAVDSTAGAYTAVWSVVLDIDDSELASQGGTCTFTVVATAVHDTDAIDPPDVMDADKVITLNLPL